MLIFDEATHTYTWNGKPVPNVTRILSPLSDFSMVPPDVLERARQEGKYVHSMIEADCEGDLDVEALADWAKPAYAAWCDFKAISGFRCLLSEAKGYHKGMGFAGTLDLVCEIPKLAGWKGIALLDVKRSLYGGPVIGLQLAAYKAMVESSEKDAPKIARRGALRIAKDGKFYLAPYDDGQDFPTFCALLTIQRWRAKHGR